MLSNSPSQSRAGVNGVRGTLSGVQRAASLGRRWHSWQAHPGLSPAKPSPPPVVHLLVGSIPIALLLAWAALLHGSLVQNSPTQSRPTGTAMEKPRWGKHVAGHALPPALGLAMPKDGVRYAQTPQGPGKSQLLGG